MTMKKSFGKFQCLFLIKISYIIICYCYRIVKQRSQKINSRSIKTGNNEAISFLFRDDKNY